MKGKDAIRLLLVISFFVFILMIMHRASGPLAAAGLAQVSATCNSCSDCTTKLASGLYNVVELNTNIWNHSGSCVGLLLGESNVTFDCKGYTIDGDDLAIDPETGVAMMHGSNNTIRNCKISDFNYGIQLWDATNHTLTNNEVTSNDTGIYLSFASSNNLNNNSTNNNFSGLVLANSNNNTINTNVVCKNSNTDFSLSSSTGNSGDNNTCDKPDGWNDLGTTGCTSICAGTTTCNSCADCTSKLNGIFDTVILNTNINNHVGTCITFGTNNTVFDCNDHTLDGDDTGADYGVYMSGKSNNTVKNCQVQDFSYGLYLTGSSSNTLTSNSSTSNANDGMYLGNSSDNVISYNDLNSNGRFGLYLGSANTNQVYGNEARSNGSVGIRLSNSNSNSVFMNEAREQNGSLDWGIYLYDSASNTVSNNDILCNYYGLKLDNSPWNTLNLNTICSSGGSDFDLVAGSTGNTGDDNYCDAPGNWNDSGTTGCSHRCDSNRCSTCSDGVRNGNETGVDCGGTYCPPCAQCASTGAKYAPNDTPCEDDWPTNDGPSIGMNNTSDSCNLVEVCDPDLDFIVEDALACCEHEDYAGHLSGPRQSAKIAACGQAHAQGYGDSPLGGFRTNFNPSSLKRCLAFYTIESFGFQAVYMQNYFDGELSCYGSSHAPPSCNDWQVDPAAWEMGTTASCAGALGATPDFQMGGHRCEYIDAWIFGNYGKHGYWNSDTNWPNNSDSFADIPAHAGINRLSTGTCVDYAFALSTILRKTGYSRDDVFAVSGQEHGYNLLRLPGEPKWHYVDTVGNDGGGLYGGAGFTDPPDGWYNYCTHMDDGCSNDYYSQQRSRCPSNDMIYGCEGIARSLRVHTSSVPVSTITIPPGATVISQADDTCTELNPCPGAYEIEVQDPGPGYELEVTKTVNQTEIKLGQAVAVTLSIKNKESTNIPVVVRETFIPGVAYNLTPQVGNYEGFQFQYYQWSLNIPAQSTETINFTVTPAAVGYYSFKPTAVAAGSTVYQASSPIIKVMCNANGGCDPGESYLFCPEDCSTSSQDGLCDMVADGLNDPDCRAGADPDYNPNEDTDGDGVLDGQDQCPLTPAGGVRDATGCACSQKTCTDDDLTTVDRCNPGTAACTHLPDPDGDEIPNAEDNCPNVSNPDQRDSDGDGIGDACEIGQINSDTILDGGDYYISAQEGAGAITMTTSNVVLDCRGATLIGDGVGYGIYVPDTVSNVTIQNCHIQNYRYGLFIKGSTGHQILNNTLNQNGYGIILGNAANNTVRGNTANSNIQAGVYLEGSANNRVLNNRIWSNTNRGLFIHTSANNDVSQNEICNNTNTDFYVYNSASTGTNNSCDAPHQWSDVGKTGCSFSCPKAKIYLPIILKK